MTLKLYIDPLSHICRAVVIFCKLNGIDFEEVHVSLAKRQHFSREFKEVNPTKLVPALMDGRFKLSESHSILRYLACSYPGIADHWYPADLYKRAKVDSVLDWCHSNLRFGAALYVRNTVLGPALRLPLDPKVAAEAEKVLFSSLAKMESVWLQENGRFLLGNGQPSIADLSLACEVKILEVLDEKDRKRILGRYKRVLKWIDDVENTMAPHFEDFNSIISEVKENLQKQTYDVVSSTTALSRKQVLHSKM